MMFSRRQPTSVALVVPDVEGVVVYFVGEEEVLVHGIPLGVGPVSEVDPKIVVARGGELVNMFVTYKKVDICFD